MPDVFLIEGSSAVLNLGQREYNVLNRRTSHKNEATVTLRLNQKADVNTCGSQYSTSYIVPTGSSIAAFGKWRGSEMDLDCSSRITIWKTKKLDKPPAHREEFGYKRASTTRPPRRAHSRRYRTLQLLHKLDQSMDQLL